MYWHEISYIAVGGVGGSAPGANVGDGERERVQEACETEFHVNCVNAQGAQRAAGGDGGRNPAECASARCSWHIKLHDKALGLFMLWWKVQQWQQRTHARAQRMGEHSTEAQTDMS